MCYPRMAFFELSKVPTLKKMYLFIYFWLCWVFVARGLSLDVARAGAGAPLRCSVRASHCGGSSCFRAWALGTQVQ